MRDGLSVSRDFAATPEAVFDGFVGLYDEPRPDWVEESRLDLRVGGTWELVFHPPGIERFREHRVITELDRPRLLAYRVTVAGPDGSFDTRVTVTVRPAGAATGLTLTQVGFPTQETRDEFAGAWPDVLTLLADRLAGS